MKKELRDKIVAFNQKRAADAEKASDMDIVVDAILKLPPGQAKKFLTEDVLAVLEKYGYGESD